MSKAESLKALNHHFYEQVASSFSSTRSHGWQGFDNLKRYCARGDTILDIACGNGRLVDFMSSTLTEFDYTGVDSSAELISIAKQLHPTHTFILKDWEHWIVNNFHNYSLITCFGMIHHLSETSQLKRLADYLYHQGKTAVISRWNCIMNTALMQRRLDLESEMGRHLLRHYNLVAEDFSTFEFLFDWQRDQLAFRYVRYWSDQELLPIFQKAGLHLVDTWLGDGKTGAENTYFVFRPTPGVIDIAHVEEENTVLP